MVAVLVPGIGDCDSRTFRSQHEDHLPSPQKIVPSPRKFTEDPLCDVQEPSERSRHTCGTSLESSMLSFSAAEFQLVMTPSRFLLMIASLADSTTAARNDSAASALCQRLRSVISRA